MVVVGEERRPVRSQDPEIKLGIEERDFEAVAGGGVAIRLRKSGARGCEASRQMGEAAQALEDGHDARFAES